MNKIINKIIKLMGFFMFSLIFAQNTDNKVGINTRDPKSELDVNGDVIVRQGVFLEKETLGGLYGWGIKSQGVGKAPVWSPVGGILPAYGNYFLQKKMIKKDNYGLIFTESEHQGFPKYINGEQINLGSQWKSFEGIKFVVNPSINPQKLIIDASVSMYSDYYSLSVRGYNSFALGVAVKDDNGILRLKSVRTFSAFAYTYPRGTLNCLFVLDDLVFTKQTEVYLVAQYRNRAGASTSTIYLGRSVFLASNGQAEDAQKASANISIFEKFR